MNALGDPTKHFHIWTLRKLSDQWAYVITRETLPSSREAHRRQGGGDYIVTPCDGSSPSCPRRG